MSDISIQTIGVVFLCVLVVFTGAVILIVVLAHDTQQDNKNDSLYGRGAHGIPGHPVAHSTCGQLFYGEVSAEIRGTTSGFGTMLAQTNSGSYVVYAEGTYVSSPVFGIQTPVITVRQYNASTSIYVTERIYSSMSNSMIGLASDGHSTFAYVLANGQIGVSENYFNSVTTFNSQPLNVKGIVVWDNNNITVVYRDAAVLFEDYVRSGLTWSATAAVVPSPFPFSNSLFRFFRTHSFVVVFGIFDGIFLQNPSVFIYEKIGQAWALLLTINNVSLLVAVTSVGGNTLSITVDMESKRQILTFTRPKDVFSLAFQAELEADAGASILYLSENMLLSLGPAVDGKRAINSGIVFGGEVIIGTVLPLAYMQFSGTVLPFTQLSLTHMVNGDLAIIAVQASSEGGKLERHNVSCTVQQLFLRGTDDTA
jgi:hypothetical protein